MKANQLLTVLGIGATIYAIYATREQLKTTQSTGSGGGRRLQQSRQWAGNGVDPFGSSYTVEKQAAAGGLS
jgi:hypothetical protein